MPDTSGLAPEAVTTEDVLAAFRWLLGRRPTDDKELERFLGSCATRQELRTALLNSSEFRTAAGIATQPAGARAGLPMTTPPIQVETVAEPEQLARMLARIGGYWRKIGEEAPHWSVLTQDRFRPEQIGQNKGKFYDSGANAADRILAVLGRLGIAPSQVPRCVEFGCGVGRVTIHLPGIFRRVTACDISASHLALARAEVEARQVPRVLFHQVTPEALMPEGHWDFWFSEITLQHNPPPVIREILSRALQGLVRGGVAMFQVPTHHVGYRFSVAEYLSSAAAKGMEMHVLPQAEVFDLAAQYRAQVREVWDNTATTVGDPGLWRSNLFVLHRPR